MYDLITTTVGNFYCYYCTDWVNYEYYVVTFTQFFSTSSSCVSQTKAKTMHFQFFIVKREDKDLFSWILQTAIFMRNNE